MDNKNSVTLYPFEGSIDATKQIIENNIPYSGNNSPFLYSLC